MDLRKREWEGVNAPCSGQGPVAGCCEHGNEPLGSITGGIFLLAE